MKGRKRFHGFMAVTCLVLLLWGAFGTALVWGQEGAKGALAPVVQELQDLIDNDPTLYQLFTEMFEQIPLQPPFETDPTGVIQARNYHEMLKQINQVLTQAPEFNTSELVGTPINAILNWPMGTPAGAQVFLDKRVNRHLKKILNQWAVFLDSPNSCYVLNDKSDKGWFGPEAKKAMPSFVEDFVCDPTQPHYGFKSWDDFFTRLFRPGRRPVVAPDDDAIIANACEAAPFNLAHNVHLRDQFWIKAQPYSLVHMLDADPWTEKFVGGTLYQAFLSALSYHRWHSPVSGTIVKTKLVDGSYYAAAASMGFDPVSANASQGYISQVAARALIFIEADNPDIGLMCAMFVGMSEVSSNEITVYPGQYVKKGDQLGMFHFGGSTHVLFFRPEVKLQFNLHGQMPGVNSSNIPVRSEIARVVGTSKQ